MKVVHFIPVYIPAWQFGGPILSVSRLCEGLISQGVDVHVITTTAGLPTFRSNSTAVQTFVNGVKVTYYPIDSDTGPIYSKDLVCQLPTILGDADLLHLSSIWQPLGISVQRSAKRLGVPVIQTLRGALSPYSLTRSLWKKLPYYLSFELWNLQSSSLIHCTTFQELKEIAWLGLKPPKCVIPNPVDTSNFSPDCSMGFNWRQDNGVCPTAPLFLVVGRMHHKKGLDILPTIFNQISDMPWSLVFIGTDEDGSRTRLQDAFKRNNLYARTRWFEMMPASELNKPYNAANYILMPSYHENFGNVVIEALACGCGAVISDKVAVGEFLAELPNVHIVPRRLEDWVAAIRQLIQSPQQRTLSSRHIQNKFSKLAVAETTIKFYKRLLANEF